jgi:hypothetical protein
MPCFFIFFLSLIHHRFRFHKRKELTGDEIYFSNPHLSLVKYQLQNKELFISDTSYTFEKYLKMQYFSSSSLYVEALVFVARGEYLFNSYTRDMTSHKALFSVCMVYSSSELDFLLFTFECSVGRM